MNHTEIVKKLIGSIQPYGSSNIDNERLENLKTTCELVNNLICEISEIARNNKDRQENSMREIGKYADDFLNNLLK